MNDDTRMGKPSSWASDQPSLTPVALHHHPLSTSAQVILVVFGLMLAVSFGGVLWLILAGQNQDDRDRAAIVRKVEHDISAAQQKGLERDRLNNLKTMRIVCTVIHESLVPTNNTRALAHQLGCDLPSESGPIVEPSTSAEAEPSPPARTSAQPSTRPRTTPHPSTTPRPTRSPKPSPSSQPTCILPSPLRCPPAIN